MVRWPAIIKFDGDAELLYIHDQTQWDQDFEIHTNDYRDSDVLIDSSGNLFSLTRRKHGRVTPITNGTCLSLTNILGLVKAHAAQTGSCCVAKLYAPTIAQALKIVGTLNDI